MTYNSYATAATGARTIIRGGDYIIAASYSSATVTNGLALINVKTKTVSYMKGVGLGASRFLWVPFHTDEVQYSVAKLAQNQASDAALISNLTNIVSQLQAQITTLKNDKPSAYEKSSRDTATTGVAAGVAGIVLSLIALLVSSVAIGLNVCGRNSGTQVPLFESKATI